MKFTLEITLGNETMNNYRDVTVALARVAGGLRNGTPEICDCESISDEHGNTVGKWEIVPSK